MNTFGRFCLYGAMIWAVAMPALVVVEPQVAVESAEEGSADKNAASEDKLIVNFHSMGEIANRKNIYRSANPVQAIIDRLKGAEPTDADREQAKAQMQHLYDLGVRTVVSLQMQEEPTERKKNPEYAAVVLEKQAAEAVGITWVACPMANKGKGPLSLQYMKDDDVLKIVDALSIDMVKRSETGGVLFHCQSGKDRTGMVAGYLRIKYQQWSLEDALREMRAKGHVWQKFLKPNETYSWHENHLRAMAKTLPATAAKKPAKKE